MKNFSKKRIWLLWIAAIALMISTVEMVAGFCAHPIMFPGASFFAMHGVVLLVTLATAQYVPNDTMLGANIMINKLESYLPKKAYRVLLGNYFLCGMFALAGLALAEAGTKEYYAAMFAAIWMLFLGGDVVLLRYLVEPGTDRG